MKILVPNLVNQFTILLVFTTSNASNASSNGITSASNTFV